MELMLDLDGVLVDFIGDAFRFHGIDPDTIIDNWNIAEAAGMSSKDFWKPLGHDFWANLTWLPDGKEILQICKSWFTVENICLLTSPTLNTGCASGKLEWIQKELPDFSRQFLIGPAKRFCSNKHRILIDDGNHNIENWDGPSILLPRNWNTNSGFPTIHYLKKQLILIHSKHYERKI